MQAKLDLLLICLYPHEKRRAEHYEYGRIQR
jgi:hypothetical protein